MRFGSYTIGMSWHRQSHGAYAVCRDFEDLGVQAYGCWRWRVTITWPVQLRWWAFAQMLRGCGLAWPVRAHP